MNAACEILHANRVGEYDVLQQGDSVFDVFYKYAGLRDFCMHSDWIIAYMINTYSGTSLHKIGECNVGWWGKYKPCGLGIMSCHYQSPEAMKQFAQDLGL